jgi:type VI secretion system protein ImpK
MTSEKGDGPFEPADRTILKPRPGGGRQAPAPPPPPPPPPPPHSSYQAPIQQASVAPSPEASRAAPARLDFADSGLDPLLRAAGPLLLLAGRLRHTTEAADTAGLRRQLVTEVRSFEEQARAAAVPTEQIAAARYALCATVDEAILSTPWGARTDWGTQPLLVLFHRETWGGEKFFQLADRAKSDPRQYAGLLEVLFVCLSLGFAGKFALDPQGQLQRDNLQHELFERIRSVRGGVAEPLSPRWQGVRDKRNPILRYVPLWVVAAAGAALLTILFVFFRMQLSSQAEPVLTALSQVGVQDFSAPAPAPAVPPVITLKRLLADLEQQGALEVQEDGRKSSVILKGSDLFEPGSARINARFEPVIDRIATALNEIPGPVLVVGHSDSQPIRSFQYQNNFELSTARALAVVQQMKEKLREPERVQSTGVGSSQPRYLPPDTPENRALNRRVEIQHIASGGGAP